jgi:hypothetical protein
MDWNRAAWRLASGAVAFLALFILSIGIVGEVRSQNAQEPALEPGVIVGGGLLIAAVLAIVAYVIWPKREAQ